MQKTKSKTTRPFGFRDKLGYFFGDFANNFMFMMAGSFLMVFYMRVLGINAAIIGTMFLAARVVDAFTDIGMGRLVDRMSPGKNGKFRPWIRRMCGPVALASFLMYQSGMANASMTVKIIYMFATYLLFGSVCYTAINIPYGSLASAISDKAEDRAALSTFRSLGGTFGAIIVSIIVPQIIFYTDAQGNQVVSSRGFMIAAGIFSVLAFLSYLLCYFLTTERVPFEELTSEDAPGIVETMKAIVTNKAFLSLVAASIVLLLSTMMGQSINAFLYADYFGNTVAMSLSGVVGIAVTLLVATSTTKITKRFGKKEAGAIGMIFTGIGYILLFFVKTNSAWVYLGITQFFSVGMTYFNLVLWAMITDVIDFQEIETGNRSDGTIYGSYSFARKIGQALAGGVGGFALAAIGYDELAVVQTESVKLGLYGLATLLMELFFLLVGVIVWFSYPLNKERVQNNTAELAKRRQEQQ